ncbi:amino acid ABC transporter permease [Lactococcus termiticola]|uniref:Amino acid ABC transporter permease protein n=1 Tax=Lactococcus termiticola TaxID=2169526 RepID=A0A2R5HDM9_9LACT|nr:amino acid ABC transporter permease [Lactococcus termiticola]GBG96122.1 amino acid ABC transporter permease protein [Lactococcus termiticola]
MSYLLEIIPQLAQGFVLTLQVFIITLVIAIPLGVLFAYLLRLPVIGWFMHFYVWVMRGTPLLLQIITVYYGLPMIGLNIQSRLFACLIAFVLNYAAYFAEIFRGGIAAIPQGQYEAAQVLRFSPWQTARLIILPQVTKIVLPSVMNEVVNLVKDSSLVYIVGLFDVTLAAQTAMNRDITLAPMFLAGLFYLLFIGFLTLISKQVEKQFSYYK